MMHTYGDTVKHLITSAVLKDLLHLIYYVRRSNMYMYATKFGSTPFYHNRNWRNVAPSNCSSLHYPEPLNNLGKSLWFYVFHWEETKIVKCLFIIYDVTWSRHINYKYVTVIIFRTTEILYIKTVRKTNIILYICMRILTNIHIQI